MPNTLTSIFTSSPATEPVEAPHPNTGVYVLGTQAVAGGTWTVVHTNVTKTATAPTMVGRLKNFPAVTASIVATGNVLNNVLATPTGASATGTSTTAINVVVSSLSNQTAYRLLASDTVGGTYAQIYQGATASFAHSGLTASQTKYYKWQYVGGGFYDDSALSAAFSGTTTAAAAKAAEIVLFLGQSNDSGLSPRTALAAQYFNSDARIRSWDKTTATAATYSLGTIGGNGNPTGANDHAITKAIVPSYDNGVGPDVGFAYAWAQDASNAGKELFIFKLDLTPPVSTNGAGINAWLNGTDGAPALELNCAAQWNAFKSYLTAQGYTTFNMTLVTGIGEQDSVNYLSSTTGGTNPDFAGSLTSWVARLRTDGILTTTSKILIAQKQRSQDGTIAAAQSSYVSANSTIAKLVQLPSPTFLAVDNTHYTQDSILRLGALEYNLYAGYPGVETSISTGTWLVPTYQVITGVTQTANVWQNAAGPGGGWATGGATGNAWRAPGTEARIRMRYTGTDGTNATTAFAASSIYRIESSNTGNVYAQDFMFFITTAGVVAIHLLGTVIASGHNATLGNYYCLKISTAGRVTVEESTDGLNWTIFYVYTQTATGGFYGQFSLFDSVARLQQPQILGFTTITGAAGQTDFMLNHTQGFTYPANASGQTWTLVTDANAYTGSQHYVQYFGVQALRTIVFSQPQRFSYVATRDTGLIGVRVDFRQAGVLMKSYSFSEQGATLRAALATPIFQSTDFIPAGSYDVSIQKRDATGDYITLDTLTFSSI